MQGGAPCLHRVRRCSSAIHRKVQQETRLRRIFRFLRQGYLGGRGRDAAVARELHGAAPRRLGQHVVAERTQIAAGEGFQIDDGGIFGALAGRPDIVCRETLGPHLLDMSIFFRC